MVNARQWLEKKYPSIEKRSNIRELDISERELEGELDLSDFVNLESLNCSKNELISLNLSCCPNLIELNCSSNKLTSLDVKNCLKLDKKNKDKFDYSENKGLSNFSLEEIDNQEDKEIIESLNASSMIRWKKSNNTKNLLIMGRTGGGKSTLANVLINKNGNFEEVFEESAGSISKTKDFQNYSFKWNESIYRIVDTIGFGDTNLSKKAVLYKIAKAVYSMPEGISQVLFVINKRFTEEEINTFNLLKDAIFESGINGYTTIIRTNFPKFENSSDCKDDMISLMKESDTIAKAITSCNDVVYLENPALIGDSAITNKIIREKSRKKLLNYLENICQGDNYKLTAWKKIQVIYSNYTKEKEEIERKEKEINELVDKIPSNEWSEEKEKIAEKKENSDKLFIERTEAEIKLSITSVGNIEAKMKTEEIFQNIEQPPKKGRWCSIL